MAFVIGKRGRHRRRTAPPFPWYLDREHWIARHLMIGVMWGHGVPWDLRTGRGIDYEFQIANANDPRLQEVEPEGGYKGLLYDPSHEGNRYIRLLNTGLGSPAPQDHPISVISATTFATVANYSYAIGSRVGNYWGMPLYRSVDTLRSGWDGVGHSTGGLDISSISSGFSVYGASVYPSGSVTHTDRWGANASTFVEETGLSLGSLNATTGDMGSLNIGYDDASSGRKWNGYQAYTLLLSGNPSGELRERLGREPWAFLWARSATYFIPAAAAGGANVTATKGAIAITGKASTVSVARRVTAAATKGAITFAGKAATVAVTGGNEVAVTATKGAATLAGKAATVSVARRIVVTATKGTLTLAGKAASVSLGTVVTVTATKGAATLAGKASTVAVARRIAVTATKGTLTFAGKAATVAKSGLIPVNATKGTITFAGKSATVSVRSGAAVSDATGGWTTDPYQYEARRIARLRREREEKERAEAEKEERNQKESITLKRRKSKLKTSPDSAFITPEETKALINVLEGVENRSRTRKAVVLLLLSM